MAWYNASWTYRIKITVDNTKVPANLTDFPVYLDLSQLPAAFFTNVKSDGGDIRITQSDGTTEQAREIVTITTGSSTGEVHFKGSSISSSTDTDFYIYYGNSGASDYAITDTYGAENAWDADFVMVAHFEDAVAGGIAYDSTSDSNDLALVGGHNITNVTGKIEGGYDLDGVNDWLSKASPSNLNFTGGFTVETWVNPDLTDTHSRVIYRYDSVARDGYYLSQSAVGSGAWQFVTFVEGSPSPGYTNIVTSAAPTGNFQYVVGRRNASDLCELIIDAVKFGTSGTRAGAIDAGTETLYVGVDNNNNYDFSGLFDEFRISKTGRSDDWVTTTHNNQNSPATFYTIGAQETDTGGAVWLPKTIIF